MIGTRRFKLALSWISNLLIIAFFAPASTAVNSAEQPVLVELFTSEGCSSCPPADRIAIGLQNSSRKGRDVIILSEHVDYWNNIGWRDNFSSPEFTLRQQDYARSLGQKSVYTPEAVVDGLYGMVGSNAGALNEAIQKCIYSPKASIRLSLERPTDSSPDWQVSVSTNSPPELDGKRVELILAVTEDNLSSNVRSGENAGAVLSHTGVVRSLKRLGRDFVFDKTKEVSCKTKIALRSQWKQNDLRLVAFVQELSTQRILGACQIKLL